MSRKVIPFIVFCAVYLVVAVGLIFVLVGFFKHPQHGAITTYLTGGSLLLLSLTIAKVLKRTIHKKRPPKKKELFMPFDTYAFPSGHATGLSSITLFIFLYSIPLGICSLIISLVIVIARVESYVHDTVDIIGGIIVGSLVTYTSYPIVLNFVDVYISPLFL